MLRVAQRQILRAAECSQAVMAILYDIFLLPASCQLISGLLKQGCQQAHKISFHKHSLGAPPIFAFGALLLLATSQSNWGANFYISNSLDLNSRSILQRLRHVARDNDRAIQRLALTFGFGHSNHALFPAVLAAMKQMDASPWPLLLVDPAESSTLHAHLTSVHSKISLPCSHPKQQ